MARAVFLSDLHLSPTHGFFWPNWLLARDAANAAAPDLIVITGDLCIDGPDSDAEMAFAGRALAGLAAPVVAIPGNHDVGDEPPGQDAKQLVDAARLARWNGVFGADHFARDLGAWRLVGLNAQLLGSGLPEETHQTEWLNAELARTGRPIALILHKPLFLDDPAETAVGATTINPEPRAALLARLAASSVRLIISGHLHAFRDIKWNGIRIVWLPALAFVHGSGLAGATPMVAAIEADFTAAEPHLRFLPLDGLVPHDLHELKQHGRWPFIRDMPPSPPVL